MAAWRNAARVVTASCPLCSNGGRWLDDHYGEGFRVPSGVRKPLMQEPAVGIP
ncbi:hypothetical protein LPU83_pLPU83c_0034 (plasmid) [Rhizobium favelukesii]|uniref:Uncharacterized protein n=1 Tax=Rhizobium favelukesii TaxID=348824 RepID=W6S2F5_9HYPH|nr:hypothetical protein LPU83_pLPU83c_0034 [Rhizobium favelukesii]